MNLNMVCIGGRITADVELKTTVNGKSVCEFHLAVKRKGKSGETDFIIVQAWNKVAEYISRYAQKGSTVLITGVLYLDKFEVQGKSRQRLIVIADSANVLTNKTAESETESEEEYEQD